jgi:hypothetical protein
VLDAAKLKSVLDSAVAQLEAILQNMIQSTIYMAADLSIPACGAEQPISKKYSA